MKILLLSLACLVGAGCSDASKQVESLADRACACKDKACADKVVDELVAFMKDNKNARGDQEKAKVAAQRLGQCVITAGVDPTEFMTKIKSAM
jgi:hypothetical protein